jgi:ribosomal protein S18 acetylase RimI-like enzyme
MSIRRAESSDAKSIAEVHVAAWRAAYRELLPESVLDNLSVEDSEVRWRERIAKPWGHIFVYEQAHRIVGYAACGVSQDEDIDREKVGEIYVIYVHPDHWREGLGAMLLSKALECLREDGFEQIILWVLSGNHQAIQFYEASGFEVDGASKVKQRADGSEIPVVRYRLKEIS